MGAGRLAAAHGSNNRKDNAYIFGVICPGRAVGAAVIVPAANTGCMNLHLPEISVQISPGAVGAVICDEAGWHAKGKGLKLPTNVVLIPLPPYSSELNSMENVWEYVRGNKLSVGVWGTYNEIVEACSEAWNLLMADPGRIRSIGAREWTTVNV